MAVVASVASAAAMCRPVDSGCELDVVDCPTGLLCLDHISEVPMSIASGDDGMSLPWGEVLCTMCYLRSGYSDAEVFDPESYMCDVVARWVGV